MPHDVFISYAAEDKSTADAVCATLEAHRIRCWIAPRDIVPGMDYGEAIVEGIAECQMLVLVFSGNSNGSEHVKNEVEMGVSRGKAVIPFRVDNVLPSGSLALHLARRHWLDALTPPLEQHLQQLANAAGRILESLRPRAPTPAREAEPPAVAAIPMVSAEPPDFGDEEPLQLDLDTDEAQLAEGTEQQMAEFGLDLDAHQALERAEQRPARPALDTDAGTRPDSLRGLPERYRCDALVGSAGFSTVYRVRDQQEGAARALKVTDLRQLPAGPARLVAHTNHPRIPRSYASWQHGDFHYEVTHFVHGWPLQTLLAANANGFGPAWAETWGKELLEILAHLHTLSPPIVHRDIKPGNIIVEASERYVVLVDMSFAAHPSPHEDPVRIVSTGYTAPEQYRGEYSTASDVYAWGATAYAILTGQPSPDASLRQAGRGLPMAEKLKDSDIGRLALRALSLAPGDRPTASQLLEELRQAQEVTRLFPDGWFDGEFPALDEDGGA